MLKPLLLTLGAALLAATATAAPRPGNGTPQGNAITLSRASQHGIRLTPAQLRTIQAVQGPGRTTHKVPVGGTSLEALRTRAMRHAPARVNASGSIFEGWRMPADSYDDEEIQPGWYTLDENGSQELMWTYDGGVDMMGDPVAFPFNTGFFRNNKIYAIGSSYVFMWAMVEYGIFTRDGQILNYTPCEEVSTDLSGYVISVAYDPAEDMAYAYTMNSDGSGYMFQSIDPETWKYTVINDNVPLKEIRNGMAFNTREGKLYGITPQNQIVRIDHKTGTVEILTENPELMPISQLEAMAYSPYDDAFVFVRPDDSGWDTQLYYVDAKTYQMTSRAYLDGTRQYPILITPNQVVVDQAPAVPVLTSLDFVGGALSGSATVQLPTMSFGGAVLTGNVSLIVNVDGQDYTTVDGQPGATVTVPFTDMTTGRHRFIFTPSQNGLNGPTIEAVRYLGYDTPLAPGNVRFDGTTVSWDAVTGTEHGGYLDADALVYNVYLDGQLVTPTPIAATTVDVTIPEGKYATHVAAVEAVNHEFTSGRGYSEGVNAGTPIPLSAVFSPTATEAALFTMWDPQDRFWYKWGFSEGEKMNYFTVNTTTYDQECDEWIFLPPLEMPETDKMIQAQVRVRTDGDNENLTVAYGPEPTPDAMTVFAHHEGINYQDAKVVRDYFVAPSAGKLYIGYKTTKTRAGRNLELNKFYVKVSDILKTAPATPENLKAQAAEQGALQAIVTFDMPTLDVSGNTLDAAGTLTATVTCGKETVEVSGLPGAKMSAEIPTAQGYNDITVTAGGTSATTRVFTGLDIPSPISEMTVTFSPDNQTMFLNWQAPTTGINGGYINPTDVQYDMYIPGPNGEWILDEELNTATSTQYTTQNTEQALNAVGVITKNASGNSGTLRTVREALGDPLPLPMIEEFSNRKASTEPMYVEMPTDEYADNFGFMDMTWHNIEQGGKPALAMEPAYGKDHSYCRVALPKVDLTGAKNPAIELSVYCGEDAGKLTVTAQGYDAEPVVLGTIQENGEKYEMKHVRFLIPAELVAKGWAQIKLNAEFQGQNQGVYIDYIKVADVPDADISLTAVSVPQFMFTGRDVNITAKVENTGMKAYMIPTLTCDVFAGEQRVSTLTMEPVDAPDVLAPMKSLNYRLTYKPDIEAGNGEILVKIKATADDNDPANNVLAVNATVCRGNQPIINDLKAEGAGDNAAQLTWSVPALEDGHEGFENYAAFAYTDQYGEFTAMDEDGKEVTYLTGYDIPGAMEPKAFQVFSKTAIDEICENNGTTNSWCKPCEGDKMLIAFVPFSAIVGQGLMADDWLVSPALVDGSEFSFQAVPVFNGTENLEIWTGSDSDIYNMTKLMDIHPFGDEWAKYNFTLPEGHTYFAVHYVSTTDNGLAIGLDDFNYVKAGPAYDKIVSYDIYRQGALLAEAEQCDGSFLDQNAPKGNVYFNVRPVIQGANGLYRGEFSNTAYASVTGLESLMNSEAVIGGKGEIIVLGHVGQTVEIFDMAGRAVARFTPQSARTAIRVSQGFYTVRIADDATKVIVK